MSWKTVFFWKEPHPTEREVEVNSVPHEMGGPICGYCEEGHLIPYSGTVYFAARDPLKPENAYRCDKCDAIVWWDENE